MSFDIDANGILQVSAKDLGTGKEQQVRITPSSGLTERDIERMRNEADANAEDDKKRRDLAEGRNKAEHFTYEVEKNLKEHGDKLEAGEKSAIEAALATAKDAAKGDDPEAIEKSLEALQAASYKLAEKVYQDKGQASAGAEEPSTSAQRGEKAHKAASGGDDNIIDADFEVKK